MANLTYRGTRARRGALARAERALAGLRMAQATAVADRWICEPLRAVALRDLAKQIRVQLSRVEALAARAEL